MTWCAIGMVAVQVIFVLNFFLSIFFGPKAGRNPWHSNGLEWQAPSPPGHGNFDFQPIVYRGPYEYGSPETDKDYLPQNEPPREEGGTDQSKQPKH
jgi:cytochrome c oxidase subunit 1